MFYMKIQLALDRLQIEEAITMARRVADSVDWLEVGTSLVKEFGMESVRAMRKAFPGHTILADMKINDNARYECALAFDAGADVVTVMAVAPIVTIEIVQEMAQKMQKQYMIDLLNAPLSLQNKLKERFCDAIFCLHTSKDEQEEKVLNESKAIMDWKGRRVAVAGGVTLERIPELIELCRPEIFIVGGAITKAEQPEIMAGHFKQTLKFQRTIKEQG